MSNPLALLPLAIAAGHGRIGTAGDAAYDASQLVAAGLTLLQRSAPLVRALSGRRSAILLPSSPQFLVALAASDGRGAVLVNPLAAPAEVAFQLADANVGAVFTNAALAGRVPAGMPIVLLDDAPRTARVVTPDRTQDVDLGSHHGLTLEGELDAPGREEEAVLVYTSAMLGRPLGAVLTHRNLLANARATIDAIAPRADDHLLALLPFAHLFGLTVTASAPLMVGARVTTMDRFHPGKAAELLAGDVSAVVGVPAVFHAMLTGLARRGASIKGGALRLCVCGGAVLTAELQERWFDATGVELRQGYGLTEAAPVCLYNRTDRPNVRGTLGTPFPGVEVAILPPLSGGGSGEAEGAGAPPDQLITPRADAGTTVPSPDGPVPRPTGVAGEIAVRGENVFPGYLHHGADGLPVRDGWLYTGDEGVRNADGTVTFLGLLKPMFTRNGFNIYPREIERAVARMREVTAVQVTPIPDAVKENDIRLRVTGAVSEPDLRAWCEANLAAYKQPSVIEIVASD